MLLTRRKKKTANQLNLDWFSALTLRDDLQEEDLLVLPLDMTEFDTHEQAVQDALDRFMKVCRYIVAWTVKVTQSKEFLPFFKFT